MSPYLVRSTTEQWASKSGKFESDEDAVTGLLKKELKGPWTLVRTDPVGTQTVVLDSDFWLRWREIGIHATRGLLAQHIDHLERSLGFLAFETGASSLLSVQKDVEEIAVRLIEYIDGHLDPLDDIWWGQTNPEFVVKLSKFRLLVQEIVRRSIDDLVSDPHVRQSFVNATDWLRLYLQTGFSRKDFNENERRDIDSLALRLNSIKFGSFLQVTQERVERQVEAGDALLAKGAAQELWSHFDRLASRELGQANVFRVLALVGLVMFIAYAFALSRQVEEVDTYRALYSHALIYLPGLAAIAFLTRESSQHRHEGRRAQMIAVQLKTFGAFTSGLNSESSEYFRVMLGRIVFSDQRSSFLEIPDPGAVDEFQT